eukprot:403367102
MLSLLCGSYMFFNKTLYRYARFKFIFTSILLTLNFLWLGYGAYVIHNMPTDFEDGDVSSTASTKKSLSILYIILRGVVIMLISKFQYDMKSTLLPQLHRFSLLPQEIYAQSTEDEIKSMLSHLPSLNHHQIHEDPVLQKEQCIICMEQLETQQHNHSNNIFSSLMNHHHKPEHSIVVMACGTKQSSYYHYKCLFKWMQEKTMCPLCRSNDILKTHNLEASPDQDKESQGIDQENLKGIGNLQKKEIILNKYQNHNFEKFPNELKQYDNHFESHLSSLRHQKFIKQSQFTIQTESAIIDIEQLERELDEQIHSQMFQVRQSDNIDNINYFGSQDQLDLQIKQNQ